MIPFVDNCCTEKGDTTVVLKGEGSEFSNEDQVIDDLSTKTI